MKVRICRFTGKVKYRNVGEARAAAMRIAEQNSFTRRYEKQEVSGFRCASCRRWHLSSIWQTEGSNGVNFFDPPKV